MSESREFNASTVEEAVSKASAYLGISNDEVSYEILDAGSEGFLGIGARDARIKVEAPHESESSHTPTSPATDESSDDENFGSPSEDTAPERIEVAGFDAPSTEEDLERAAEEGGDVRETPVASGETAIEAPEWLIKEVRDYVSSVIGGMGLDVRLDVYDTEECIAVDIATDHTALVIGQKGETIDSLQYLTNSAIYKDREFVKRIVLDSEGYRQRRIEAIQGMAHRTARKSIREGREIQMPPMSSSERRIVHMYLKENPRVTTFSEGTGADRRITVAPS